MTLNPRAPTDDDKNIYLTLPPTTMSTVITRSNVMPCGHTLKLAEWMTKRGELLKENLNGDWKNS